MTSGDKLTRYMVEVSMIIRAASKTVAALAFALYAAFVLALILVMTFGLYALAFLVPPD